MTNSSKLERFPTVLVGFGKIAQANAFDKATAHTMTYATHAQVLQAHPGFDWRAVVDPNPECCTTARTIWNVPEAVESLDSISRPEEIAIAVLATPPDQRSGVLKKLPNLKAVIVEKPLGLNILEAKAFLDECANRGIIVQVNFLRRADAFTRALASGQLREQLGEIQCAFGVYGRGLLNNGIHIVDLARMLFGEALSVQALSNNKFKEGPIDTDLNVSCMVFFESGVQLNMQPLQFKYFRENGLEIWGEKGRLDYLNSGFSLMKYPIVPSSTVTGEHELDFSTPVTFPSTLGTAFYELYDNLWHALTQNAELVSSGASSMKSSDIVESVVKSAEQNCSVVTLGELNK